MQQLKTPIVFIDNKTAIASGNTQSVEQSGEGLKDVANSFYS